MGGGGGGGGSGESRVACREILMALAGSCRGVSSTSRGHTTRTSTNTPPRLAPPCPTPDAPTRGIGRGEAGGERRGTSRSLQSLKVKMHPTKCQKCYHNLQHSKGAKRNRQATSLPTRASCLRPANQPTHEDKQNCYESFSSALAIASQNIPKLQSQTTS
ncbi:hypothetical protein E2C01_007976 [Portunus trituberculatus]|uniref:Uncharacterized protein n=1 Tax=Portunus trituberculatus TaxID=210409 RepID=A0A5B7CZK3_PORTR|nr:hypothetical protein [Portunus trituberculatus]